MDNPPEQVKQEEWHGSHLLLLRFLYLPFLHVNPHFPSYKNKGFLQDKHVELVDPNFIIK